MKQQIEGDWFIPSYPSTKLPGILTIDESEIVLALFSQVDFTGQPIFDNANEIHRYTIILGEYRNRKITLLNSDLLTKNKIGETLHTFTVSPETVLEGAHFNNEQEIKINSMSCSYSFITAWMEDLMHESHFKDKQGQFHDFDGRFYKRISVEIDDEFMLHIEQFLREHDLAKRNSVSFRIHHSVVFTAKRERGMVEFERKAIQFQKLMELGLDCPSRTQFLRMSQEGTNGESILIWRIKKGNSASIDADSYRNHGSMLFSYFKLGENEFKQVIQNWFNQLKTYEVVYNIYLDTHQWFKDSGAYLTSIMFNNRFLNVMQGLEHYHRLANEQSDESKKEFEAKFQTILCKLEITEQEWLKERTSPLSKKLRKRLNELLKNYDYVFAKILTNRERRDTFINQLCEIRNSLSHGRNTNLDIGAQKYEIYEQARILLLACILDSLGITKEKAQSLITRSHEYGPKLDYMARQH